MSNEIQVDVIPQNAIESISRAEIDVAIATARKFPRQLSAVKQKMLTFATLDQETAESCFYTLPRGGKNIQGPSVRLAEIAVSTFGNLRAGARILSTTIDGPTPHVVVQAVAMDLENNIQVSIEKRRRITKKKNKEMIDEDDINLAANAGSAIAFRDAVFKVIPMALIKPVYEQAKRVAIGDAKTISDRRARCVETFAKMGISKDRVIAKVDKKTIEEIDLGDVEILIGLYNAIKDGEVQIDEAFPEIKQPKFGSAPIPTPPDSAPPEAPAEPPSTDPKPSALDNLKAALVKAGITEGQCLAVCLSKKIIRADHDQLSPLTLADIREDKMQKVADQINAGGKIAEEMKAQTS